MTTTEIILSLVGTLIGGGGVGFFFNYLINKQKEDKDGFKVLLQTWSDDNHRLRVREMENESKIHKMQIQIDALQTKLSLMESAHFDLPVPQWLKDTDGKMLGLNQAYVDLFLTPIGKRAKDYIGNFDKDIWPDEIVRVFAANDSKVLRTGKPVQTVEEIDLGTHKECWEILKYPRYSGRVKIGIGGIAFKQVSTNN